MPLSTVLIMFYYSLNSNVVSKNLPFSESSTIRQIPLNSQSQHYNKVNESHQRDDKISSSCRMVIRFLEDFPMFCFSPFDSLL